MHMGSLNGLINNEVMYYVCIMYVKKSMYVYVCGLCTHQMNSRGVFISSVQFCRPNTLLGQFMFDFPLICHYTYIYLLTAKDIISH